MLKSKMARFNANVELGDLLVVGGLTFSGLWLWDHHSNDGKFLSVIKSSLKNSFLKIMTRNLMMMMIRNLH